MDTAVIVAVITGVFGLTIAAVGWHINAGNNRTTQRTAAEESARRAKAEADAELAEIRQATDAERREYERLRDERLREFADQLGTTRIALANCQLEAAALRDQLGQRQHGGLT